MVTKKVKFHIKLQHVFYSINHFHKNSRPFHFYNKQPISTINLFLFFLTLILYFSIVFHLKLQILYIFFLFYILFPIFVCKAYQIQPFDIKNINPTHKKMKKYYCLFLFAWLLPILSFGAKEKQEFILKKGVNISHWLSQSATRGEGRAAYFTRKDVAFIASLGFDHLRIPIDEEQMFDEAGKKEPEAFQLLHHALEWCNEFGLRAVVDLHILRSHHFNDKERPLFTEEQAQERFYECWRQLSKELKRYPNHLVAYELMNEPVADDPEQWNRIVNRCAEVIRKMEPERTLIIGSNRWQSFSTVKDLRVPENDSNIILSFHYYDPFLLTHYRASWTDMKDYRGPVHYPGALIAASDMAGLSETEGEKFKWWGTQTHDINKTETHFKQVLDEARKRGLKVYCGEYGCISGAPAADRYRWFRDVNTLFERHGIARAVWDYKGGFGIVENGVPQWPIIEALTRNRGDETIRAFALHPDNPRYFIFRGEPTLLITSGEHYGMLVNEAFNFDLYLETLHNDGLNSSRLFMGPYIEPAGAFNIPDNTLAPASEHYVSPWKRSAAPGYASGGNKFDLSAWNPAYFERLHQILQKASELGIVLELTLFCPMYDDAQWNLSPMNIQNNINGIGNVTREKVYTLDGEKELLQVQEAFVRKIVSEVNGYDNFYFEICNEPYFGGVTDEWQKHITDILVEAEQGKKKQHLISVNVANGSAVVSNPHPAWSLFNFHYCTPPVAVAENAHLNKPVGMNETGFHNIYDEYYRREAWNFMMAGGALYNHLDYSFTVGKEDGSNIVLEPTPGGGSPALRKQLGAMKRFFERLRFLHLTPVSEKSSVFPSETAKTVSYLLAETGKQYAFYCEQAPKQIEMNLPEGNYQVYMLDTHTLREKVSSVSHGGGTFTLTIPQEITDELAISLMKQ